MIYSIIFLYILAIVAFAVPCYAFWVWTDKSPDASIRDCWNASRLEPNNQALFFSGLLWPIAFILVVLLLILFVICKLCYVSICASKALWK